MTAAAAATNPSDPDRTTSFPQPPPRPPPRALAPSATVTVDTFTATSTSSLPPSPPPFTPPPPQLPPAALSTTLFCFLSFVVCSLDRINLAVAIIPMSAQFGWSNSRQGLIQSIFFAGYMLTMIWGGSVSDLHGGRTVLYVGVLVWSLCTFLTPFVASSSPSSLPLLLLVRILLGAGEGVAMPSMNAIITRAVPPPFRARAVAFIYSGMYVGSIIGLLVIPALLAFFGWPAAFYSFGVLGFVWVVAFLILSDDPPPLAAAMRHGAQSAGGGDSSRSAAGSQSSSSSVAGLAAAVTGRHPHVYVNLPSSAPPPTPVAQRDDDNDDEKRQLQRSSADDDEDNNYADDADIDHSPVKFHMQDGPTMSHHHSAGDPPSSSPAASHSPDPGGYHQRYEHHPANSRSRLLDHAPPAAPPAVADSDSYQSHASHPDAAPPSSLSPQPQQPFTSSSAAAVTTTDAATSASIQHASSDATSASTLFKADPFSASSTYPPTTDYHHKHHTDCIQVFSAPSSSFVDPAKAFPNTSSPTTPSSPQQQPPHHQHHPPPSPPSLRDMMSTRAVWAIIVGQFCFTWGYFVLVSWLPTYLFSVHSLNVQSSSLFSALPWLCMFIFANVGGVVADTRLARGVDVTSVRKFNQAIGFSGPIIFLSLLTLPYAHDNTAFALLCIAAALATSAFSQAGVYANHQDIGPSVAGTLLGISSTFASVPGLVGVWITGVILDVTDHNWNWVFALSIAFYAIGLVVYTTCATGKRIW